MGVRVHTHVGEIAAKCGFHSRLDAGIKRGAAREPRLDCCWISVAYAAVFCFGKQASYAGRDASQGANDP